ncbi:patatin-like phospholipase family protein [Sneathiella sp.]|jgi:NTE family protein|uniref:patatin-like phospholipase family protein n=1 Tax=Sneathiella sp. TaxID=1964365 RepID=UPI0025D4A0DE|nr:patatin-like phospholipase family protein [Sneathiella sp.]
MELRKIYRPKPERGQGDSPPDQDVVMRPKVGLALGSGVARGWAHIGVLKRLEREAFQPDYVCGTSIGALIGGMYLAGKLDALEEWARDLGKSGLFRLLDIRLSGGGLISGNKLFTLLEDTLGNTRIEDLPVPFAAVTTELGTGHEIWIREGNLAEAITASYALPGLFSPQKIHDRWLIDGALTNPVPVSVCRALGARLVIAVNLNADVFGMTNIGEAESAFMAEEAGNGTAPYTRAPLNLMKRRFFDKSGTEPSIFGVMMSSLNIVQDRLSRSRLAGDPPDITIAPRLARFGLLEFNRAAEMIAEGEDAADRSMDFLKQAMDVLA